MSLAAVVHDFAERLEFSASLSDEPSWIEFYRRIWPEMITCVRIDKDSKWQRHGVDRMIIVPCGRSITIDEKKRERCKKNGILYDDFLCEEFGNYERGTVGWSLDREKICDFIAYSIPELGKCYLLPFELLRITCEVNLPRWKYGNKPKDAPNRGYVTRNWAVPWHDLFDSMKKQMHRQFGDTELQLPLPVRDKDQLRFNWNGSA